MELPYTFDLDRVPRAWRALFDEEQPWRILARLDAFWATLPPMSEEHLHEGEVHPTAVLEGAVLIEAGARIGPHAFVQGPAWLMAGAEVGHGAYLRGGVLLAPHAKVGHATEVKRSVFLSGAKAPHFNYVGDSVLGHDVNLGAGVKVANLKAFGDTIAVGGESTGLRKFGALVGDRVSIGCNAVLAPGTVVGAGTVVYHGAMLRGLVPAESIVKVRPVFEIAPRRG